MNRRDFLQLLALLGAGTALPRFALAAAPFDPAKARFFVLLRVAGGWDVTLSVDPKVHANGSNQTDMFIEYTPDKIVDAGGVMIAPAAAPLLKYKGEFSVVNGIIMGANDQGHTSSEEYISSGNGEGKAPYLAVELANAGVSGSLGVVFNGTVRPLDRTIMLSSTSSVLSFKTMLDLSEFSDYLTGSAPQAEYSRAQKALIDDRPRLQDLMARLKDTSSDSTSADQAAILSAAFASGTSMHGQIDIRANLDTHSGHEGTHMSTLTKALDEVVGVFDVFKQTPVGGGASLFDRTVFMVTSEFARTPALNAAKGKDHNPLTNSVILAGGGIRGGRTIGESHLVTAAKSISGSSVHAALPLDFSTMQVARTKKDAQSGPYRYVTPENVVATVAHAMNVDWSKFKSVPPTTPAFPSLIKPV